MNSTVVEITPGDREQEKAENEKPVNREKTCPLLLRVFCGNGRHHNLMEYSAKGVPANELQIYTWMDATLKEIMNLVKEVNPDSRRKGTTFDFAVVCPTEKFGFRAKDIGTTTSGVRGPDDAKTLAQLRFQIGDFMDVAITPPNMNRMGSGMMGGPMRRGGRGHY